MNCWAVLGIERTTDTSVIRKAYKQQLLINHPEDHPEGYQNVREAYTAAMNEAKRQERFTHANTDPHAFEIAKSNTEATVEEDQQVTRRILSVIDIDRGLKTREIYNTTQPVNDFMMRVVGLYNDGSHRNDPNAWTKLLTDDALWDLQLKSAITGRMLQFFSQQYNLNDEIWKVIESHTGLFNKITKNTDEYPAFFVDTYALATQEITVPRKRKLVNAANVPIIKMPPISWWRYCLIIPYYYYLLMILLSVIVIPIYIIWIIVRSILFVRRRNWNIVMWEYTFTHFNNWGKQTDYSYIDIVKIVRKPKTVTVYLKDKKIRIKARKVQHLDQLLAKMSRYGRTDGNAIIVQERPQ